LIEGLFNKNKIEVSGTLFHTQRQATRKLMQAAEVRNFRRDQARVIREMVLG